FIYNVHSTDAIDTLSLHDALPILLTVVCMCVIDSGRKRLAPLMNQMFVQQRVGRTFVTTGDVGSVDGCKPVEVNFAFELADQVQAKTVIDGAGNQPAVKVHTSIVSELAGIKKVFDVADDHRRCPFAVSLATRLQALQGNDISLTVTGGSQSSLHRFGKD